MPHTLATWSKSRLAACLSALLLILSAVFALSACATSAPEGEAGNQGQSGVEETSGLICPADYDEVVAFLQAIKPTVNGSARTLELYESGGAESASSSSAETATNAATDSGASGDYSTTNVQVEGIDEGDVVKTDGVNIYSVSGSDVVITRAAGQDSDVLSRFYMTDAGLQPGFSEDDEGSLPVMQVSDLFICEDTLVVVYSQYQWQSVDDTFGQNWCNGRTRVGFVDVSDPSKPTLGKVLSQDGFLETTRMVDGSLVVVSSARGGSLFGEIDPRIPETFMPCVYDDDLCSAIAASDLAIDPQCTSAGYTMACVIDVASEQRVDTASLLGPTDTVYMSGNRLYLCGTSFMTTESDPYKDSVYTVIDYEQREITRVTSFDISADSIDAKASTQLDGSLVNQFALDEYDGYLRVALTKESYSYKILTDKTHDIESYQYGEDDTSNHLVVLDADLSTVGAIEDLAPGEEIYSVRFDGAVGYVVTFEQVDPLFAIDLSSPQNPTVTSALKIPGFSRYLHVYGEGRLFGLGNDVSLYTSSDSSLSWLTTDCLKLSMFDTSDPFNVTEKDTFLVQGEDYSDALYDHRAVFVSPENDIIGFPVISAYMIYGYSDDEGFYERARIENDSEETSFYYYVQTRGLYIGDSLYIVSEGLIRVLDLDSLEEVAVVSLIARG